MYRFDLSVIVPCYNEKENIPLIVKRFKEVLPKTLGTELILVDNGSTDGSGAVMRRLAGQNSFLRISKIKNNIGYGYGVWCGLKRAAGKYICWTHADLQTDLKDVVIAYYKIKEQQNPQRCFVKGKRKERAFFDLIFTFGMSIFVSIVLRKTFHDINAQPNIFHRDFLRFAKNPPRDFSFDLYFYYLAKKCGYKIVKFPVLFRKRVHGKSSWNTDLHGKWKFITRTVNFTFKLKKYIKSEEND